jgi:plasminogen activator inhibitor 1 RNA-binding protein
VQLSHPYLQEKSAPKAKAKKETKETIEIEGYFERPQRGGFGGARGGSERGRGEGRGRGRGEGRGRGRGEGRGRGDARGRGGFRGGYQNGQAKPALQINDESAFPSLS